MAPTARFLVRDRARVIAGSATGIDRWYTGSRRGDPPGARPVRTPAADRARLFSAVYGTTGVTDDLLWPHSAPSDDAKGDSASSPVSNPVSKPRVLDGGDAETR
jgi:hypothetical protein